MTCWVGSSKSSKTGETAKDITPETTDYVYDLWRQLSIRFACPTELLAIMIMICSTGLTW